MCFCSESPFLRTVLFCFLKSNGWKYRRYESCCSCFRPWTDSSNISLLSTQKAGDITLQTAAFIQFVNCCAPVHFNIWFSTLSLHNEEPNDLYCPPNIIRVIKSGKIRWAGHVARMGRWEAYTGFWWGNLKERDHLGITGVNGIIILRWIFRKCDGGLWTGSSWLRIGTGGWHLWLQ